MFDSAGRFILPSPESIAGLDAATRGRFEAVQAAAREHEAACAASKAAIATRDASVISLREAETHMREVAPPVSAVDAARAWILTQQRGY
jgi:hypothetical protein